MFTKSELKAMERRTPAELNAINAWWRDLSEDERQEHLGQRMEEVRQREHKNMIIFTVIIISYAIFAGIPAVVMLLRAS